MVEIKMKLINSSEKHFSSLPTLIESKVDLDKYPRALVDIRNLPGPNTQLTIGDLHGNALKLIYFIIREKIVVGITPEDYINLVSLYKKSVYKISKEDLMQFKFILDKAYANSISIGLIRFIGDILCDRGSNDFFTLLVLKRLGELKIPLEIIASNHDVEFMLGYEASSRSGAKLELKPSYLIARGYGRSMGNLQRILDKYPELSDEIIVAIEEYYLPVVKLLSYTVGSDNKVISLYTHAPVGLETIQDLAEYFNLNFNNKTLQALVLTIDNINKTIERIGGVSMIYALLKKNDFLTGVEKNGKSSSLRRIIWNREYTNLKRPASVNVSEQGESYSLCYVHGHDSSLDFSSKSYIFNLDDWLGKNYYRIDDVADDYGHQGIYRILRMDSLKM